MLEELYSSVMEKERKKGQRHKVFEDSPACRQAGLMRKNAIQISLCIRDYMQKNPVSKKWFPQLSGVNDFTDYIYSSASYYQKGIKQYDKLLHVN